MRTRFKTHPDGAQIKPLLGAHAFFAMNYKRRIRTSSRTNARVSLMEIMNGKLGGKINLLGIELEWQQGKLLTCVYGSTEIADKFIENDSESECCRHPAPRRTQQILLAPTLNHSYFRGAPCRPPASVLQVYEFCARWGKYWWFAKCVLRKGKAIELLVHQSNYTLHVSPWVRYTCASQFRGNMKNVLVTGAIVAQKVEKHIFLVRQILWQGFSTHTKWVLNFSNLGLKLATLSKNKTSAVESK